MHGRIIVNNHAIKERLAGVDKTHVMLAVFLIMLMVFHVLEMQHQGVIKGVIRDGAVLRGGGLADEAVNEVGDGLYPDEFTLKRGALLGGEIFFEPEVNVVKHGFEVGR